MFVGAGKSVTHRVGQEAETQPGVTVAVFGRVSSSHEHFNFCSWDPPLIEYGPSTLSKVTSFT